MKDENRENKRAEAPEAPVAPETGPSRRRKKRQAEIVELSEDTAEFDLEAILEEYTGQQEGAADAPESSPGHTGAGKVPGGIAFQGSRRIGGAGALWSRRLQRNPRRRGQTWNLQRRKQLQRRLRNLRRRKKSAPEEPPQEPGGEDPEDTARFIQEQVTSALGDSYSEETLREQELRAAQIRKARERKEARRPASSGGRSGQRPPEAAPQLEKEEKSPRLSPGQRHSDAGVQAQAHRDTINTINEKAMNYADEMYAQADAGRWSWNRRARRLRRARWSRRPGSGRKSFAGSAGPGGLSA